MILPKIFLFSSKTDKISNIYAGVAKLVDVPDLGSGAVRHGGSSPSTRTSSELKIDH